MLQKIIQSHRVHNMFLQTLLACLACIGADAFKIPDIGRVVNGVDAKPGEIPYIVSLRWTTHHYAAGSILNKNHILTCAHTSLTQEGDLSIQHGITKISKEGDAILVTERFINPNYDSYTKFYDIAVFKLEKAIIFDDLTKPIVLPQQYEPLPVNELAVFAGWGYTKHLGEIVEDLQRVDLLVFPDVACKAAYQDRVNKLVNFCAGIPEGGKGHCNGDSGGPLVVNGKQYGALSWGQKPCGSKYPGVYTLVAGFVKWINEQIVN